MSKSILTFSSQTAAAKAARVIKKADFSARIVSVDPAETSRGCAWGVMIDSGSSDAVRDVLARQGVAFGEMLVGGI